MNPKMRTAEGATADSSRVRVGVIGTGAITQVAHLPILAERPDVELMALADVDQRKAEMLSRRFEVPLVMDSDEIVDFDLDAVVVATPNATHEPIAMAALERGKHVFVERPIAISSEGAMRMLRTAEKAGRSLTVGMPHRYRAEAVAIRELVAAGELGELRSVRGSRLMRSSPQAPTWRQSRDLAGGGALVDLGVTVIDLILWLSGYPEVARVSCVLSREGGDVEETASLMFVARDGPAFTVEVGNNFRGTYDSWFTGAIGTKGSVNYPPLTVSKEVGGRPTDVTPRLPRPSGGEDAYTNAYRRQIDEFVWTVKSWGGEDAPEYRLPMCQVELMKLVEAAYRSAAEGREVVLAGP